MGITNLVFVHVLNGQRVGMPAKTALSHDMFTPLEAAWLWGAVAMPPTGHNVVRREFDTNTKTVTEYAILHEGRVIRRPLAVFHGSYKQ